MFRAVPLSMMLVCAASFAATVALSQQPQMPRADDAAKSAKIERLPTSNDAIAAALIDLQTVHPAQQPYIRYVWVADGDPESAKALSFTMNVVSRSNAIRRPELLGSGKLVIARIDLRWYAPKMRDLEEWLSTWEDFQFDPRFNLLITKGTLKFAVDLFPEAQTRGVVRKREQVLVDVPEYVEEGTGNKFKKKWVWKETASVEVVPVAKLKDVELVRLPAPHLDQPALGKLQAMTHSQAPLVTDAYLTYRALSTIQDKGVYKEIYGGRYYQLAGIKKGAKKGTDEDVLLEDLGVGNVDKGITAKKIFAELRSDQRSALFRSGVTGSPRQVEFFRTLTGRIDLASGLISFTHDLRHADIDIDTHPIANLLDFKDAAREVIWERPNGLHGYALFNGQGALQDEVPPDVAKDHTIPAPHTARLQSAISCISCHEADGSDGWKKVTNDVKKLIDPRGGIDIFGDTSNLKGDVADTRDRLAGLYMGEPERALIRGRDDYASAVLKATGPWKGAEAKGQTNVVKFAAQKVVEKWRTYWYDQVDSQIALAELGVHCKDKAESVKVFAALVGPEPRAAVDIPELGGRIIPEDPRIGALRVGLNLSRSDWELVYAFAAERAAHNMARVIGNQKEKKK